MVMRTRASSQPRLLRTGRLPASWPAGVALQGCWFHAVCGQAKNAVVSGGQLREDLTSVVLTAAGLCLVLSRQVLVLQQERGGVWLLHAAAPTGGLGIAHQVQACRAGSQPPQDAAAAIIVQVRWKRHASLSARFKAAELQSSRSSVRFKANQDTQLLAQVGTLPLCGSAGGMLLTGVSASSDVLQHHVMLA